MKRLSIIAALTIAITGAAFARAVAEGNEKKIQSFTVSKGGTLDVSINGGDIRIITWEKNEVMVTVESSDDEEDNEMRMSQQGNTVRITDRDTWGESGRLDINVPYQFNLRLETTDGDITVRGKLTGDITGETSAGNIKLGDVEGTVDMRTSGGDIRTGRITGKASLITSGGEVEVISTTGELDLKSSGGDIRVGNVGKSLRAKTAGGDIVIGDVGGEAVASTAGGNVRVGKVSGQATLNTAGGDIELSGGNGAIKASTSGGNLLLMNLSGSVEAKTAGGDIHAELIPSGKGKSRLASASGIIKLYVPENAKATIVALIRIRGWWRSHRNEYSIRSDFKEESSVRDEDEQEIQSKYVLNGGGETITLETVNSDIEIRKLKK
jgi:DUF4097 and DUF4098 domain-containing protein YvlB